METDIVILHDALIGLRIQHQYTDSDEVSFTVHVRSGYFAGMYSFYMPKEVLRSTIHSLRRMCEEHRGTCEILDYESDAFICIEMGEHGQISVRGRMGGSWEGHHMKFQYQADHTFLERLIQALTMFSKLSLSSYIMSIKRARTRSASHEQGMKEWRDISCEVLPMKEDGTILDLEDKRLQLEHLYTVGDYLTLEIEAKSGYFAGRSSFCMPKEAVLSIIRSLTEMHDELKGSCRITDFDSDAFICTEMREYGHMKIHGQLGGSWADHLMKFEYYTDQTILEKLIRLLNGFIRNPKAP